MMAVLLCGPTAHLSHDHAAALLGVLARRAPDRIAVTGLHSRRVPGWIRLHRVRMLPEDETTTHDHIPITSPARTLLDLAGSAPAAEVEHAMIETLRRRLAGEAQIAELLARYPRRAGTPLLRRLLERAGNPQLTRSEAERILRELIRSAEIAMPVMNVRVQGYQVDAYWREERVVVEVDGFALHSSHAAFQRDRRRDADLIAAGITVVRVTWHQLTRKPNVVIARPIHATFTALSQRQRSTRPARRPIRVTFTALSQRQRSTRPPAARSVLRSPRDHNVNAARVRPPADPCYLHRTDHNVNVARVRPPPDPCYLHRSGHRRRARRNHSASAALIRNADR
jgi:very-short-patch-repair endonuclease